MKTTYFVRCFCNKCVFVADKHYEDAESAVKNAYELRDTHSASSAVSVCARNLITVHKDGGSTMRNPHDFYIDPPQEMFDAYDAIAKAVRVIVEARKTA